MESKKIIKDLYTPGIPKTINKIAAYILDVICVVVLSVGIGLLLSYLFRYDIANNNLDLKYLEYGIKYIDEAGNIVASEATTEGLDLMWEAFYNDPLAISYYNKVVDYSIIIPTIAISISLAVFEFVVPLVLKHGRTVGYFVFKIGLLSNEDIEVSPIQLAIRCFIGKLVINTLIPIYLLLLISFEKADIWVVVILLVILFVNQFFLNRKPKKASLPDRIAKVYPVDYEGQVFVKTVEELNKLKRKVK